jgi:hypothetical protein
MSIAFAPPEDAWFLTHLSPFAAIEEHGSWDARARSGEVFMFERAVIVDRSKQMVSYAPQIPF